MHVGTHVQTPPFRRSAMQYRRLLLPAPCGAGAPLLYIATRITCTNAGRRGPLPIRRPMSATDFSD